MDFPEVTTKKAMAIKKSKELLSVLGNAEDITLGICSGSCENSRAHSFEQLLEELLYMRLDITFYRST
jgi:hypothetical protein